MRRDLLHLCIGLLCGLLLAGAWRRLGPAVEERGLEHFAEACDFVQDDYVRVVSRQAMLEGALKGMVGELDDYSRYYGPAEVATFERETGGTYRGIGVVFRRPASSGRVLFTLPGSPAERAGLRVGDRLLEIDGDPISALDEGELQRRISLSEAASVCLLVRDRGAIQRTVVVEREALIDPTVRHARIVDAGHGIGYLALTSFSHHTVDEFDLEFERLRARGARALLMDLRGNSGGVLQAAVEIANRFVERGLIVSTEGRGEHERWEARPDLARWRGFPLVVLADQDSASASEVLAGALQDHRAAVLVGTATYGKGMVQKIHWFGEREAALKLTSAYYYTPAHRNLERTVEKAWEFGLQPDVLVEIDESTRRGIQAHLATYSPPESALEDLRRWEREENLRLIELHPRDPQLDAALSLLRGEPLVAKDEPALAEAR